MSEGDVVPTAGPVVVEAHEVVTYRKYLGGVDAAPQKLL
jgi:hypothetical protein